MIAKRLAILASVATLASGVGCIPFRSSTYTECLLPVEAGGPLAPQRARVYTFIMNGADPLDLAHLKDLEKGIHTAGYPKVYYAQRLDEEWYYREIHRLHRDHADNRFVLVGFGLAFPQMESLSRRLTTDGIPIDAMVFLDPAGPRAKDGCEPEYPYGVLRSRFWPAGTLEKGEGVRFPDAGHFHLPNHPDSVGRIVALLQASAAQVPDRRKAVECIPVADEPKPIPRPNEPKQVSTPPPEWDALCPPPGHR